MLLQNLVDEDYGYEHNSGIWGRAASHNSLVVNEESQFWFWNSRGIKGNVRDYLILVREFSDKEADAFLKENRYFAPVDVRRVEDNSLPYDKLVEILWSNGKNQRDYWYRRLLNDSTIDKFRLGFYDNWYVIPLYDDGRFLNFEVRKDIPNKVIGKWYRNVKPILFNAEILDFVDTIYISEGTVGAILLNQLGFPAVSQMGSNIWQQEWYGHFAHIKNIYYIEDNDNAGRIASANISKALGVDRVKIISFSDQEEKYDAVDFFRDGGSVDDFKELVSKSIFLYERELIMEQKKGARRWKSN